MPKQPHYVVVLDDETWLRRGWEAGASYYRTDDPQLAVVFRTEAHAIHVLATIRRVWSWPQAVIRARIDHR